jgi:phosphoglycerol transferase
MCGSALRHFRLVSNGLEVAPDYFQPYRQYQTPAIKKNLVLIYAESLERTYFDEALFPGLVPNLKRLARTGLDFTDLRQVPSQSYTLAGIVSSQTGVPFVVPSLNLGNAMSCVDLFYPGAEGFGQVLKRSGYRLVYLGGADSRFAGKDKFLRQNGYDEVLGMRELSNQKGDDPADGWGLRDDTLLRIAKDRIVELSASKQPYVLTLLTLDTHFPKGRVAPSLRNLVYRDGSNPMLNAVHAADVLISDFINEIRNVDKSGNTVIVLVSDHLSMLNTATEVLNRGKRRNMMLILDPDGSPGIVSQAGTLFDVGPTIMSRLGYMGGFGLGVDLLKESRRMRVVDALVEPNFLVQFENFFQAMWHFPKFTGKLIYEPKTAQIGIGERRFYTPVLCKIDGSGDTRFYFEHDTDKKTASISLAFSELFQRDKFFYVGDWRYAPTVLKGHRVIPDNEKVVIWGRVGGPVDVRSLSQNEAKVLSLESLR